MRSRNLAIAAAITLGCGGLYAYLYKGNLVENHQAAASQKGVKIAVAASTNRRSPPQNDQVQVPTHYQFVGNTKFPVADNYSDLRARYGDLGFTRISAFYGAYSGGAGLAHDQNVFAFHDVKELDWLIANGYPSPDEILAADRMTEAELQALADQGNYKGKVFLLDRLDATDTDEANRTDPLKKSIHTSAISRDLLASGSPFGALAFAKHAKQEGQSALAAAALSFASNLGDDRDVFLRSFLAESGNIPSRDLLLATQIIQLSAGENPSLRDSTTLARRPRFTSISRER